MSLERAIAECLCVSSNIDPDETLRYLDDNDGKIKKTPYWTQFLSDAESFKQMLDTRGFKIIAKEGS